MIQDLRVTVTAHDRTAQFVMTFDSDFGADRDMRLVIERDGGCEREVTHLLHRVIQTGDVVVDGGANVGFFTLLMSQLVGKTGLVFACEPAPINISKLQHNLVNNAAHNVRVVKSPLYSKIAPMTLHLAPHSGFNSLTASSETVGRFATVTTTIDDMLDGQVPKLIKLDVEGAELHALEGGCTTLTKCPYVVIEMNEGALHRFGASYASVRKYMELHGYDMFILQIDGRFPLQVPRYTELVSERENLMVLFSTPEHVAKAWPVLVME